MVGCVVDGWVGAWVDRWVSWWVSGWVDDVSQASSKGVFSIAVVVVLTLTRIIKSVVTRQAPVTLELRNTPGKGHKQTKGGTRIYHS